jgi:hypothetical protein
MANEPQRVGQIHVDSGQILILDPVRLTDIQYDSVVRTDRADHTAEVWLEREEDEVTIENFLDAPRRTNDGVVVETGGGGSFSVLIEYGEDGMPV